MRNLYNILVGRLNSINADNENQVGANEGKFILFIITISFSAANITSDVNLNCLYFLIFPHIKMIKSLVFHMKILRNGL
jgi:hypothetical protein